MALPTYLAIDVLTRSTGASTTTVRDQAMTVAVKLFKISDNSKCNREEGDGTNYSIMSCPATAVLAVWRGRRLKAKDVKDLTPCLWKSEDGGERA